MASSCRSGDFEWRLISLTEISNTLVVASYRSGDFECYLKNWIWLTPSPWDGALVILSLCPIASATLSGCDRVLRGFSPLSPNHTGGKVNLLDPHVVLTILGFHTCFPAAPYQWLYKTTSSLVMWFRCLMVSSYRLDDLDINYFVWSYLYGDW